MDFGKRIHSLRLKVGKSQKKIESETGIPQRTLSDWENSKTEPCASDIVKLATALEVTVAELFIGD